MFATVAIVLTFINLRPVDRQIASETLCLTMGQARLTYRHFLLYSCNHLVALLVFSMDGFHKCRTKMFEMEGKRLLERSKPSIKT